jgi:hypothetical protein
MTHTDNLRLLIFKKQIEDKGLTYLSILSDKELLELMDSTVVANAVDLNAIKTTNMFGFIFIEKKERKERLKKDIEKIINLTNNLTKTEKVLIKFGLIIGFKSKNWKKEMFRYINTPLSLSKEATGRKIISSSKFKEIFYFIYNLVKRGKENERLPKF